MLIDNLYQIEDKNENEITIKKAKFLKPALPDQIIVFQRDNNKFKILHDNNQIANFVL
jgi:hypothetical protein